MLTRTLTTLSTFVAIVLGVVYVENNGPIPSIPEQFYGLNWSTVTGEAVYIGDYPHLDANITGKVVLVSREKRPSDPLNLLRQAVFMNDIRNYNPKAVITHSLSFFKAAGYDEWQNYGTEKLPAKIPVVELVYPDWLNFMAQVNKANETNNDTVTVTLTSEGVNYWDLTYGPGPIRVIDWLIAVMFFGVSVWACVKLFFTTKTTAKRNVNIAQVSYVIMVIMAIVMLIYCICRALVAKLNSYIEASLQLIFQQLVFTTLVIIAAYWTEMMGAVLPKHFLTQRVQTAVAVVTFVLLTIMILLTILIPVAYKSLPTTIIAIGPAEFVIITIWYNIAGFKLISRLRKGSSARSENTKGRTRLIRVIITVCTVTLGLIISLIGTLLFLSYSPIIFFVGAILSRIGILVVFVGVVYAFKVPKAGSSDTGATNSQENSNSRSQRSQRSQHSVVQ